MDFSSFYVDTEQFVTYSLEHGLSILAVAIFGWWFVRRGATVWSDDQRWRYAIILAIVLYGTQLFKVFIRLYLGNFDKTTDLPLELCNLLPLFMIIALVTRSRLLLSIIFFWILGGTSQANVTPTLRNVLPHYEAIRYWAIHMGLPILAIYSWVVLGFRYTFKDVVRSALALNVLAAVIYPLNLALGSNYLFLMGKPDGTTIYDLLGPWPWYIMSIEFVMLVVFSIILLHFLGYERWRGRGVRTVSS